MSQQTPSPMEPTPEELRSLRALLSYDNAEARVVWGYFARLGHIGATTFVPGDPHASAINEGKRIFTLKIADLVGMSPMNFLRRN